MLHINTLSHTVNTCMIPAVCTSTTVRISLTQCLHTFVWCGKHIRLLSLYMTHPLISHKPSTDPWPPGSTDHRSLMVRSCEFIVRHQKLLEVYTPHSDVSYVGMSDIAQVTVAHGPSLYECQTWPTRPFARGLPIWDCILASISCIRLIWKSYTYNGWVKDVFTLQINNNN